jgi:hypothetical protein
VHVVKIWACIRSLSHILHDFTSSRRQSRSLGYGFLCSCWDTWAFAALIARQVASSKVLLRWEISGKHLPLWNPHTCRDWTVGRASLTIIPSQIRLLTYCGHVLYLEQPRTEGVVPLGFALALILQLARKW